MEQQACFDQSDIFAFLADPATHELREPIIRIDTHGAAVFLAGKNVYKVKRAVRFPFMDFSTLDKRRRACERERRQRLHAGRNERDRTPCPSCRIMSAEAQTICGLT